MSDTIESPNHTTAMAETEQSPPQSTTTAAAAVADKFSNISFSIWPPSDRTRDAVRNRLVETLSTPSILSKRYGLLSGDEAVAAAKAIEEEAFDAAGKAAVADDDGIEILQVYSKEISKLMLDKVKTRSADAAADPTAAPPSEEASKAEEVDAGSNAPPRSEKTESVADDE